MARAPSKKAGHSVTRSEADSSAAAGGNVDWDYYWDCSSGIPSFATTSGHAATHSISGGNGYQRWDAGEADGTFGRVLFYGTPFSGSAGGGVDEITMECRVMFLDNDNSPPAPEDSGFEFGVYGQTYMSRVTIHLDQVNYNNAHSTFATDAINENTWYTYRLVHDHNARSTTLYRDGLFIGYKTDLSAHGSTVGFTYMMVFNQVVNPAEHIVVIDYWAAASGDYSTF